MGVTALEKALRVHLRVWRRESVAAVPARRTSGALAAAFGGAPARRSPSAAVAAGRTRMSHTSSPPVGTKAGADHTHFAARSPPRAGAREVVRRFDAMVHSLSIP